MEAGPAFLRGPGRFRLHTYCFLQVRGTSFLARPARMAAPQVSTHVRPVRTWVGGRGGGLVGDSRGPGRLEGDPSALWLSAFQPSPLCSRYL